jgi:hypothetical protein
LRPLRFRQCALTRETYRLVRTADLPNNPLLPKNSVVCPKTLIQCRDMSVTIDTEGISDEQKESPKFKQAYAEMTAQLTEPGFAEVLCLHEAAHVLFFGLAGMTEYDAYPARIRYNPAIDDYEGDLASVQVKTMPLPTSGRFWEWFKYLAAAHAAGGVISRKFLGPFADVGDQSDRLHFQEMYEMLKDDPNVPPIDMDREWKEAQNYVLKMLDAPTVWDGVHKLAAELRPQFGL